MTWPVERRLRVDSTMHEARRLAAAGCPEGTTVVAQAQTAGRGRRGRAWESPPGGGIWMTTVLRPRRQPAELQGLALVAGLAVWRAVAALVPGAPARVKWPNDVWVEGRKLAGVLLEGEDLSGPQPTVLLGIGMNLRPAAALNLPAEFAARSIGLDELAPLADDAVLAALLAQLQTDYGAWCAAGLRPTLQAWPQADALAGCEVEAEHARGPLRGAAEGLDATGRLRLRVGGDILPIAAGEVRLVRPLTPPDPRP